MANCATSTRKLRVTKTLGIWKSPLNLELIAIFVGICSPCDARLKVAEAAEKAEMDEKPAGGWVGPGKRNFCGEDVLDARKCTRERHCPSGLSDECPPGLFCWNDVAGCNIDELPTMNPTISPEPTEKPSPFPTTPQPVSATPFRTRETIAYYKLNLL